MADTAIPCPKHCTHTVVGRRKKHGKFVTLSQGMYDYILRCCWCGEYWDVQGAALPAAEIEPVDQEGENTQCPS